MRGRARILAAAALAAAALAGGCSNSGGPPVPLAAGGPALIGEPAQAPPAPAAFDDLELPSPDEGGPETLRASGLREAALGWGAGHGQARRSWEIARSYSERAARMDAAWNFRRAALPAPMSAGWLLPPVVQRAGAAWSGGGREAEAAVEYYRILRPARIAAKLPGWRDYLPAPSEPPEPPAVSLRPRPEEEKRGREWAAEGWRAGIGLAEAEHEESLARLERDFAGMLEFRRLLSLGMITDMVVEAEHWPAAVSEDGAELRIGGRRVGIIRAPGFVGDAGRWTPRIVEVRPETAAAPDG